MGIKEGDFVSGNFILKLTLAILIIFFYINGTSIALDIQVNFTMI